eukprot:4597452-Amphidinium_carterae.2
METILDESELDCALCLALLRTRSCVSPSPRVTGASFFQVAPSSLGSACELLLSLTFVQDAEGSSNNARCPLQSLYMGAISSMWGQTGKPWDVSSNRAHQLPSTFECTSVDQNYTQNTMVKI